MRIRKRSKTRRMRVDSRNRSAASFVSGEALFREGRAVFPVLSMEFPGCCFEDSLFSESRDRTVGAEGPYEARQCEPQWFNEDMNSEDHPEIITVLKFRGDFAYRRGDYEKALTEYENCCQLLPQTNAAMRRDVQESQARCLVHLRRFKEALEITETMRKSVLNTDHLTCTLIIEITILSHLGNWTMLISCLQQLVSLHPFNPWMWKKLAESYQRLFLTPQDIKSVNQTLGHTTMTETDFTAKEQLCLYCCARNMDRRNDGGNAEPQGQNGRTVLGSCKHSECCTESELWIVSCASLIRARLLLQLVHAQQASFVLVKNEKAQREIEEQLKELGIEEETQVLMTEIMGEDLSTEGLREEGQLDLKTTIALSSLCMPTGDEFKTKWFEKVRTIPRCMKMNNYSR
uniref:Chromosome 8 open reading frame 76 n=1 Tax=Leptobrachium leishanense TaxID=445787 RepID=A0A8C5MV39_9ANUR